MKKSFLIIGLAAILSSLAIYVYANEFRSKGKITVLNCSNEVITAGSVFVCGKSFGYAGLQPGESQSFNFPIRGPKAEYVFSVHFASGKNLSDRNGYVGSGFNSNAFARIGTSKVELNEEYN